MDWMRAATKQGDRWVRWTLVVGGLLGVVAAIIVLAEPAIGLATLAMVTGIFLVLGGVTATAVSVGWLMVAPSGASGAPSAVVGLPRRDRRSPDRAL